MKLEKECYINSYEFDIDGWDYITLVADKCFTTDEKNLITENYNKKVKLTLEVEEPILDAAEKKYLSNVIKPFRKNIKSIEKVAFTAFGEFIRIVKKDNFVMSLFPFKKNTMYQGMELNKEYNLEELGL